MHVIANQQLSSTKTCKLLNEKQLKRHMPSSLSSTNAAMSAILKGSKKCYINVQVRTHIYTCNSPTIYSPYIQDLPTKAEQSLASYQPHNNYTN